MFRLLKLIVVVLLLSVFTRPIDTTAQSIQQLRPNYFVAGIPSAQFEYFSSPRQSGRQRQANWCWAATVQMVLNYHGLYVTQEQVVQRIYGALLDRPAQPAQIMQALSGWAPDARGRRSTIHASNYIFRGSEIVNDLGYGWPIIVGLRGNPIGHAYVLTGVYYSVDWRTNEPIFDRVVLRDPWPGSPSRQEMSWYEFQSRLSFATRVRVGRL